MVLGGGCGFRLPTAIPTVPMRNDQILALISEFCRRSDMAELNVFGRRAVNDGKLVHRLREGKRITDDTLDRIQAYIRRASAPMDRRRPPGSR